jgi:acyl dehydratase
VSDWVTIDQAWIDWYADCTGDRQWIHVDHNYASAESPFGGEIDGDGELALSGELAAMIFREQAAT